MEAANIALLQSIDPDSDYLEPPKDNFTTDSTDQKLNKLFMCSQEFSDDFI